MKRYASMLGVAMILVFAGCAQQPEPAPEPDTTAADTENLRALVGQFVDAWNAADMAVIGPMVADDVVLMQPDGPLLQGREVDEVIVLGDYAYTRGTWNTDPTSAAGADAPSANGKWSLLFKRGGDDAWQMSRWMWNQEGAADTTEG
jgi:ketosteroid isomerase-like protein